MTAQPPPYPRIPYLAGGGPVEAVVPPADRDRWLRAPVLAEEKLDGANVVLWFGDGGALNVATRAGQSGMDRAGQLGRLRAWAAEHDEALRMLLAERRAAYGEWLWLQHSVPYDRLPTYLVVIDLWSANWGFHPVAERDASVGAAGMVGPPVLARATLGGVEGLEQLTRRSTFRATGPAEGVVLRRTRPDGVEERCKWVREDFQRLGDDQWRAGRTTNRLADVGMQHQG
jgi:hypothetical protein